jgi:hypothetical protein
VYVAGYTNSTNFPGTTGGAQPANAGGYDAFVARLTADLAAVSAPPVSTPGRVTGGGFIQADGTTSPATLLIQNGTTASIGGKATFGFVVKYNTGDANPSGNLTYDDHGANVRIKALSFNLLLIGVGPCGANTHAKFRGLASVTGPSGVPATQTLDVDVDDCAEPGSSPGVGPDMFTVTTVGGTPYTAAGPLVGGNIQIQRN